MTKQNGVTAILLAGGKSSRMGQCKAELKWQGTTLIEYQVEKLRSLGIEDIVISGYANEIKGTRFAEDVYKHKGPLGGIHAGLKAAHNPHCLVLSVDTPLVPTETLAMLIEEHISKGNLISLLEDSRGIEPLIGMYEKKLHPLCDPILKTEQTAVRELYKPAPPKTVRYHGDDEFLVDCNTPEDYRKAYASQTELADNDLI